MPIIVKHTTKDMIAYTDDFNRYNKLKNEVGEHHIVCHSEGQHVDGDFGEVHTQTIEGAWSIMKRSIRKTYTSVSPWHLQKYLNEFDFRHNDRKDCMFWAVMRNLT